MTEAERKLLFAVASFLTNQPPAKTGPGCRLQREIRKLMQEIRAETGKALKG